MSFSDAEIQAAVERLVLTAIRRPLDTLGVRRADVTFSDFQEATSSIFILYPNAPFYVVSLGARRLREKISSEAEALNQLLVALEATSRHVLPVEDVSPLYNARAALQSLANAASGRTGGFQDITKVPSHVNFEAQVKAFTDANGAAIKQNGQIVPTPNEARLQVPGLVRSIQASHAALVESAQYLSGAMEDYSSLNLPSVVATGVLSRAASVVGEDADTLNALPKERRLEQVRGVILNLLAAKAVVRTYGSFSGPSDFLSLAGTGVPYSDASLLATPAWVLSDTESAVVVVSGVSDTLTVALDGGAPETVTVNASPVAVLQSTNSESVGSPSNGWLVGDGVLPSSGGSTPTPKNNEVRVRVRDNTGFDHTYVAPLTRSATFTTLRTASQIAADIQAVLPVGVVAEAVFVPLKYSGYIDVAAGVGSTSVTVPGGAVDWEALGVEVGDRLLIDAGPNAGTYAISAVTTLTLTVTGTSFTAETNRLATVGPELQRLQIRCTGTTVQVQKETSLAVVTDGDVTSASTGAVATFGFADGATYACRQTKMADLAEDLNTKVPGLACTAVFVPTLTGVPGRSEPANGQQVTLSHSEGVGDTSFAGPTLTLSNVVYSRQGSPQVGDKLVLRTGPDFNTSWTVTGLSGTTITATGLSGTDTAGVRFEVGPALVPQKYDVLQVLSGVNSNTYSVSGPGDTALDVLLSGVLPVVRSGTSPVVMSLSYGRTKLRLASSDRTTGSMLALSGSFVPTLFASLPPITATGTTPWFKLPSSPKGLQVGDLLELYPTQYNDPDSSHEIDQVLSGNIVRVVPDVSSTQSWNFGDIPVPFARIRAGRAFDYRGFKARLDVWLNEYANSTLYFTNLNRLLNPILANSMPTAEQVGEAIQGVNELFGLLTAAQAAALALDPALTLESILGDYAVDPMPVVDTLIHSYKEKGASRAVDLLVSGQFSVFFGLSAEQTSYAGAMQGAIRDVAMNDLPVRKTNRLDVRTTQLIASSTTPDPEYTRTDVESAGKPESL